MLKKRRNFFAQSFVKLKLFGAKLAPAAPTPLRGGGDTRKSQVAGCVDESIPFGGRVYLLRQGLSWKTTSCSSELGGHEEISSGARALPCSTTWKVFEREYVPSKRYASAKFTPLHVVWFSFVRDRSRG